MIKLRELKGNDAAYMLEWMHDASIQKCFKKKMKEYTLEDAKYFCINSKIPKMITDGIDIHYAIANEDDEYLGTISLKNIDLESKSAEYAIVMRKKAQGHGNAYMASMILLKKAFSEYGLHRVYLNVLENNKKAINMYEKIGFNYEGEFRDHIKKGGEYLNLKWYGMISGECNSR